MPGTVTSNNLAEVGLGLGVDPDWYCVVVPNPMTRRFSPDSATLASSKSSTTGVYCESDGSVRIAKSDAHVFRGGERLRRVVRDSRPVVEVHVRDRALSRARVRGDFAVRGGEHLVRGDQGSAAQVATRRASATRRSYLRALVQKGVPLVLELRRHLRAADDASGRIAGRVERFRARDGP
eukprot:31502-Pelagococcus_subviridis.AAC.23